MELNCHNNGFEVHPRSEATATADDDDDDEAEDEEELEMSAKVFMELDLPQWKSTARRINHSQEETIAEGGGDVPRSDIIIDIVTDFPRKSS